MQKHIYKNSRAKALENEPRRSLKLLAFHGFLGCPRDWKGFSELDLVGVDLSQYKSNSLWRFGKEFNEDVEGDDNVLLGYSMGGRLAMHCLIDAPEKWKAGIIVSGGPGLVCENEKRARVSSDLKLLERFRTEDFDRLIAEWNKQSLFNQELEIPKKNKAEILNDAFINGLSSWSLGRQEDLREQIAKLPMPIFWIVGEKDVKYRELTAPLKFLNKNSRVWVAENAFHRVPWEVKTEFQNQVNTFLREVL